MGYKASQIDRWSWPLPYTADPHIQTSPPPLYWVSHKHFTLKACAKLNCTRDQALVPFCQQFLQINRTCIPQELSTPSCLAATVQFLASLSVLHLESVCPLVPVPVATISHRVHPFLCVMFPNWIPSSIVMPSHSSCTGRMIS